MEARPTATRDRRELDRLLLEVQAGRLAAWNLLLEQLAPRLYVYAFRLTGRADAAADITQEALRRVFTAAGRLEHNELLVPWCLKITRNAAWRHLERAGRRERQETPAADAPEPETLETPLDQAVREEERACVREALRRLEPEDRDVLHLRYFEELAVERIAAVTGSPAGTVKWRLHEARRRLKTFLEKGGSRR